MRALIFYLAVPLTLFLRFDWAYVGSLSFLAGNLRVSTTLYVASLLHSCFIGHIVGYFRAHSERTTLWRWLSVNKGHLRVAEEYYATVERIWADEVLNDSRPGMYNPTLDQNLDRRLLILQSTEAGILHCPQVAYSNFYRYVVVLLPFGRPGITAGFELRHEVAHCSALGMWLSVYRSCGLLVPPLWFLVAWSLQVRCETYYALAVLAGAWLVVDGLVPGLEEVYCDTYSLLCLPSEEAKLILSRYFPIIRGQRIHRYAVRFLYWAARTDFGGADEKEQYKSVKLLEFLCKLCSPATMVTLAGVAIVIGTLNKDRFGLVALAAGFVAWTIRALCAREVLNEEMASDETHLGLFAEGIERLRLPLRRTADFESTVIP